MDGLFSQDARGTTIQRPNGFTLVDATRDEQGAPAPLNNPIALTANTPESIVWPKKAIGLKLWAIGNNVALKDNVADLWIPIDSKVWFEVPGRAGDVTTIKSGTGTTVSFCFEVLA